MPKIERLFMCAAMLLLISCEEPFFRAEPGGSAEEIFNQVWQDFDRTYPSFAVRKVNWDSVYNVYYRNASTATTDDQLFVVLGAMTGALRDGHVTLISPTKLSQYNVMTGRHINFLGLDPIRARLTGIGGNRTILYGVLPGNIGYIYISSWSGQANDYSIIDSIVASFSSVKGIIVDVRNNGGGNDLNAEEVAGRFTDQKRLTSYTRYKNGTAHDALSDYFERYIEPKGTSQKTDVPIIVLTNRACYSANEHFILSMRALPYVRTLGDTTGGGSSNPMWRELPHGWRYRIPRWLQYDLDKKTFEAVGIFPDYPVWISKGDSLAKRDAILEDALSRMN